VSAEESTPAVPRLGPRQRHLLDLLAEDKRAGYAGAARTASRLRELGLIDSRDQLTDAGRAYLTGTGG
jgi:hypothetical protein